MKSISELVIEVCKKGEKMKQILMSRKPQEMYNILSGKQKIIILKNVPKDFTGWVNLICTNGICLYEYEGQYFLGDGKSNNIISSFPTNLLNRKVICRFWLDEVDRFSTYQIEGTTITIDKVIEKSCLTYEELEEYEDSGDNDPDRPFTLIGLYALPIKNLEIFAVPKELGEFYKANLWATSEVIKQMNDKDRKHYQLTKVPSTWMYVEVGE